MYFNIHDNIYAIMFSISAVPAIRRRLTRKENTSARCALRETRTNALTSLAWWRTPSSSRGWACRPGRGRTGHIARVVARRRIPNCHRRYLFTLSGHRVYDFICVYSIFIIFYFRGLSLKHFCFAFVFYCTYILSSTVPSLFIVVVVFGVLLFIYLVKEKN